jgi:hypothetical protein
LIGEQKLVEFVRECEYQVKVSPSWKPFLNGIIPFCPSLSSTIRTVSIIATAPAEKLYSLTGCAMREDMPKFMVTAGRDQIQNVSLSSS